MRRRFVDDGRSAYRPSTALALQLPVSYPVQFKPRATRLRSNNMQQLFKIFIILALTALAQADPLARTLKNAIYYDTPIDDSLAMEKKQYEPTTTTIVESQPLSHDFLVDYPVDLLAETITQFNIEEISKIPSLEEWAAILGTKTKPDTIDALRERLYSKVGEDRAYNLAVLSNYPPDVIANFLIKLKSKTIDNIPYIDDLADILGTNTTEQTIERVRLWLASKEGVARLEDYLDVGDFPDQHKAEASDFSYTYLNSDAKDGYEQWIDKDLVVATPPWNNNADGEQMTAPTSHRSRPQTTGSREIVPILKHLANYLSRGYLYNSNSESAKTLPASKLPVIFQPIGDFSLQKLLFAPTVWLPLGTSAHKSAETVEASITTVAPTRPPKPSTIRPSSTIMTTTTTTTQRPTTTTTTTTQRPTTTTETTSTSTTTTTTSIPPPAISLDLSAAPKLNSFSRQIQRIAKMSNYKPEELEALLEKHPRLVEAVHKIDRLPLENIPEAVLKDQVTRLLASNMYILNKSD